jgi:hypothetical protein
LELVKTIERELIWKAQEVQNNMIQWGVDVDSEELEEGWPSVPVDAIWSPFGSEDPNRTHGWLSIKEGVEVDALEHQRSHSTYRCL